MKETTGEIYMRELGFLISIENLRSCHLQGSIHVTVMGHCAEHVHITVTWMTPFIR